MSNNNTHQGGGRTYVVDPDFNGAFSAGPGSMTQKQVDELNRRAPEIQVRLRGALKELRARWEKEGWSVDDLDPIEGR